MYIEKDIKKEFQPIKIVIETQEEVEHLLYRLCVIPCPSDPKGIESLMRKLILKELNDQNVDFEGYADRQHAIQCEYKKTH